MSNVVQFLIKPKGLIEIELIRPQCAKDKRSLSFAFGLCLCVIQPKAESQHKARWPKSSFEEARNASSTTFYYTFVVIETWSPFSISQRLIQNSDQNARPTGRSFWKSSDFKTNVLKSSKSLFSLPMFIPMGKCHHILVVEHHILAENSQNM